MVPEAMRDMLKQLRPDMLAVHSSKAGILGRLAGRSLRIPVLMTAHGWNFTPGIPAVPAAMYRQIERWFGPHAHEFEIRSNAGWTLIRNRAAEPATRRSP